VHVSTPHKLEKCWEPCSCIYPWSHKNNFSAAIWNEKERFCGGTLRLWKSQDIVSKLCDSGNLSVLLQ